MTIDAHMLSPRILDTGKALFGILLVATLSACAPQTTQQAPQQAPSPHPTSGGMASPEYRPFFPLAARETLAAGLENIHARYLEPIDLGTLAFQGINGLSTIDPTLRLERSGVALSLTGEDGWSVTLPNAVQNTPQAWAAMMVDLVERTRHVSADLAAADNETVYEAIFDGMLAHLDVFSRYAGHDEARDNRERRNGFGGIGVAFRIRDGWPRIHHVQPGSPAEQAGIRIGDRILQIDGQSLETKSPQSVRRMLHGPVQAPLRLSISRPHGDERAPEATTRHDFTLKRAHIVVATVHTRMKENFLHLKVSGFNAATLNAVTERLHRLRNSFANGEINGIVLDLRGNHGGMLRQSVEVADLFLNQGTIAMTAGRHHDSNQSFIAVDGDLTHGVPMAVLIDAKSASAAEVLASALQDQGRAVVVGTASYGKGTVQTVIRLPNDGEITLTWSRLITPSGYGLHALGVLPTVCADGNITLSANAHDTWRRTGLGLAPYAESRKLRQRCNTAEEQQLSTSAPNLADLAPVEWERIHSLLLSPEIYARLREAARFSPLTATLPAPQ